METEMAVDHLEGSDMPSLSDESFAMLPVGFSGLQDIAASPVLDAEPLPPIETQSLDSYKSSDCESGSTIAHYVPHLQDSNPFVLERGFWRIHHGARELLKYANAYQEHRDNGKTECRLNGEASMTMEGSRFLPRAIDLEAMTQLSWGIMRAVADITAYDRRRHMSGNGSSILLHSSNGGNHPNTRVMKRKRQRRTGSNHRSGQHPADTPAECNPKVCKTCGAVHSPLWRYGPEGLLNLCNVCGLLYAKKTQRKGFGDRLCPSTSSQTPKVGMKEMN